MREELARTPSWYTGQATDPFAPLESCLRVARMIQAWQLSRLEFEGKIRAAIEEQRNIRLWMENIKMCFNLFFWFSDRCAKNCALVCPNGHDLISSLVDVILMLSSGKRSSSNCVLTTWETSCSKHDISPVAMRALKDSGGYLYLLSIRWAYLA